jgi:hypothetical protein
MKHGFVKLDQDGNIEWQKRDEGYSLNQTSDGGYITLKGSRLVKLGGIKHDAPPTGIFQILSLSPLIALITIGLQPLI